MAYRLIRSMGRSFVSLQDKVSALAEITLNHTPAKEVITPLYEKAGRKLPKTPTMIVSNWRKAIDKLLEAGDESVIALCQEAGIIEDSNGSGKKPGKKK